MYRYGEELEANYFNFPLRGQHEVTAEDIQAEKAVKADLLACSSAVAAIAGEQVTADEAVNHIMKKLDKLKAIRAASLEVGMPQCKYMVDRAIIELERGKQVLDASSEDRDFYGLLSSKLRLIQEKEVAERKVARIKSAKEQKRRISLSSRRHWKKDVS